MHQLDVFTLIIFLKLSKIKENDWNLQISFLLPMHLHYLLGCTKRFLFYRIFMLPELRECQLWLQVVRLIYTNSGLAVLALASNAVHKLWKWQRSERNPSGKVCLISVYICFPGFLLWGTHLIAFPLNLSGYCIFSATNVAASQWYSYD